MPFLWNIANGLSHYPYPIIYSNLFESIGQWLWDTPYIYASDVLVIFYLRFIHQPWKCPKGILSRAGVKLGYKIKCIINIYNFKLKVSIFFTSHVSYITYVCMHLSLSIYIYLSISLSIYLFIFLSFYLSTLFYLCLFLILYLDHFFRSELSRDNNPGSGGSQRTGWFLV